MGVFQFVNAISSTPTVLLDLDVAPLSVQDSSVNTPPPVRYSSLDRALVDGSNITRDQWEDREIRLEILVDDVSAEAQATVLQTLARIVARGGCWLKWQPPGMVKPVFFYTKKPDLRVMEEILDATPDRSLRLEIPAEPFAFGLPETFEITFRNDPTTAGGGQAAMLATLPTIKGDVPTPLGLSFATPEADHNAFWASQAVMAGTAQVAAYWKSFAGETVNASPGTGVTITDAADTTMVAGTRRRVARSSGSVTSINPAAGLLRSWTDLPAGDYRAFVRVFGADENTRLQLFNRIPDDIVGVLEDPAADVQLDGSVQTPVIDWIDMGVVSMPFAGPVADNTFGLAPAATPAPWALLLEVTGNMSIDLDGILLVPAGRPGIIARQGFVGFSPFYDDKVATIDPLSDQWYALGESVYTPGLTSPVPVVSIGGSAPVVVPGAVANQLLFMATTSTNAVSRRNDDDTPVYFDRISDDKARTTVVTCTYKPRYMQIRPDAT